MVGPSLLVAVASRHRESLFELLSLAPVWQGQVWRFATWTFIESSPIAPLFGALFLYWFGGDLANEMGSRRFLGAGRCGGESARRSVRPASRTCGWSSRWTMIRLTPIDAGGSGRAT
jgi:Rhomboid family